MSTTISYLDRFLEPMTEAFTPEMARKLVDLRAEPELQARVDQLAEKANQGTLSAGEETVSGTVLTFLGTALRAERAF